MNNKMSRKRRMEQPSGPGSGPGVDGVEFDMKKARLEIMKFAMNSLSGEAKQDAETSLAINLGAKRPKNLYVNYKELQATRKAEKTEKEARRLEHVKPMKSKKPDPKNIRKGKKVGHKLETTGVYKLKVLPRNSKPQTKSNDNRRKRR